jgi:uncharacterized protein (TIGR02646 family)
MVKLERPLCPYPDALANFNYKHPLNKQALKESSYDKCMYCESKISHIDFAHIEHIKPKAEGKFPGLAYEWNNLGYACPRCNNAKSDKFYDDLPFIDPYSEKPEDHIFACGAMLFQKNGSERGQITIKEIELNRPELLEKRLERVSNIIKALDACHKAVSPIIKRLALIELAKEAEVDKEYSIIVKAALISANMAQIMD